MSVRWNGFQMCDSSPAQQVAYQCLESKVIAILNIFCYYHRHIARSVRLRFHLNELDLNLSVVLVGVHRPSGVQRRYIRTTYLGVRRCYQLNASNVSIQFDRLLIFHIRLWRRSSWMELAHLFFWWKASATLNSDDSIIIFLSIKLANVCIGTHFFLSLAIYVIWTKMSGNDGSINKIRIIEKINLDSIHNNNNDRITDIKYIAYLCYCAFLLLLDCRLIGTCVFMCLSSPIPFCCINLSLNIRL